MGHKLDAFQPYSTLSEIIIKMQVNKQSQLCEDSDTERMEKPSRYHSNLLQQNFLFLDLSF